MRPVLLIVETSLLSQTHTFTADPNNTLNISFVESKKDVAYNVFTNRCNKNNEYCLMYRKQAIKH